MFSCKVRIILDAAIQLPGGELNRPGLQNLTRLPHQAGLLPRAVDGARGRPCFPDTGSRCQRARDRTVRNIRADSGSLPVSSDTMIGNTYFPEQMRFGDSAGGIVGNSALKLRIGECISETFDILPDRVVDKGRAAGDALMHLG